MLRQTQSIFLILHSLYSLSITSDIVLKVWFLSVFKAWSTENTDGFQYEID